MSAQWFYRRKGLEFGPLTSEALKHDAEAGSISPETQVRRADLGTWVRADHVKGLFSKTHPEDSAAGVCPKDESFWCDRVAVARDSGQHEQAIEFAKQGKTEGYRNR